MTLKENFLRAVAALFVKLDGDESIDEEIRETVDALNVLRESRMLFEICMEEAQYSKKQLSYLAELIIDSDDLRCFWKIQLRDILDSISGATGQTGGLKKPLTLPKLTTYDGTPGEFLNWWALTEQMLTSNHIPKSQWPGAILGQVGSSALAVDEILAIMHDDDICGLAPEDMVELMI